MLDILLLFKSLLLNPLFWGIIFLATSIPQFFIAKRLHHHQAWYAFVPILSTLQWFQLGRVPTRHLLAFIPLVAVFLLPAGGPETLITIITTIQVVITLQAGLYLWFFWFRAARVITVRAGERESHAFWLIIPVAHVFVLARFALRKEFWVQTAAEKNLINTIINGVDGDHKLSTVKKYASSHGFNKHDFELVADKALSVKNNDLNVVTSEAHWVHFINYFVGVAFAVFAFWASFTLLQNFSVVFSEPQFEVEVAPVVQTEVPAALLPSVPVNPTPSVPVNGVNPDKYVFIMEVSGYDTLQDEISFSGSIRKGGTINREADRFYLLDRNFVLIESVKVQSVTGLFGQFKVNVNRTIEPDDVVYLAETADLRAANSLGEKSNRETSEALAFVTNHDGESTAQNRELIVDVKYDALEKSDNLYVFDKDLNLIDTAEIVYLLNPQKSSVESVEPSANVELVLEFEAPYTGDAYILSPLANLKPVREYLELLDL